MRLFIVSLWIASKHSSRRLLCLLCVFLVLVGLGGLAFTLWSQREPEKAVVAVVNQDRNPLSRQALDWLTKSGSIQGLEGILELRFFDVGEEPEEKDLYTAVVTIPDGFLESVLNGTNLSPRLEVDISSPLEAMWVESIAQAGARWLTNAQLGVYTVQEKVDYGRGMDPQSYDLLLAGINLTYLRAFLDRLDPLTIQQISASGGLSLPAYYLLASIVLLLYAYGFLFQPTCADLQKFSQVSGKRWMPFFANAVHVYLLNLGLCVLGVLISSHLLELPVESVGTLFGLAFLVGGMILLLTVAFQSYTSCAAACLLSALGMGACGGGFLPLPLMPLVFERIAPFLPFWQGMRLLGQVFGEPGQPLWQPLGMGLLLWTLAAVLWCKRRGALWTIFSGC